MQKFEHKNLLIESSYTLGLSEQRLLQLAVTLSKEADSTIKPYTPITLHVSRYAAQFSLDDQAACKEMREASRKLFERYMTYQELNPETGRLRDNLSRWVTELSYDDLEGAFTVCLSSNVVLIIEQLKERYLNYNFNKVAGLNSYYAIRLYELLTESNDNHVTKPKIIHIDLLRSELGIGNSQYKTMSNFKRNVLDFVLDKINQTTNITASYTQEKAGRKITGFRFTVAEKTKPKIKKAVKAK